MKAKQYWDEKRSEFEKELQILTTQSTESAFSPAEWRKFDSKTRRRLGKAYAQVCDRVVHKLRFSRRFGWNPLNGAHKEIRDLLWYYGSIRLVYYIGQSHDGRSRVLTYPPIRNSQQPAQYGEWQYTCDIDIRPNERNYGATFLAMDMNDRIGNSVCYRDGVSSATKTKCKRQSDALDVDITDILEEVLHEVGEEILDTLSLFGSVAFGQVQHDKLQTRIKAARTKMQLAERCVGLWDRVHLPETVLVDMFNSMVAFSTPNAKVGAVILKGVPGTGKTFLAANIAESSGAKFLKAGVNRLKRSHIGESAEAVKELWNEARANKPCVIFIDECDSVFAKRGSREADTMTTEITNAFLTEWTGKEPGIWILAATNRSDLLDDGILDRFGTQIEVPLPDGEARVAILRQELHEAGYKGAIPSDITSLTQGMSGRDLSQIAQKAAAQPAGGNLKTVIGSVRSAGNHAVDADATWNSLVLDATTMETLKTTCAMLQEVEEWRSRGVQVANGILLEGPPGTGKTQIARTIANESHLAFVKATTADFGGTLRGEKGINVKNLFERARSMSPSILFIDELDICAPARSSSSADKQADDFIGQILQEMSGIESSSCHVFVLAATNHRELIDPAVLERFTETLHIPLPDVDGRTQLLKGMLSTAKANFSLDEVFTLAGISEGMSGRHLKNWVTKAQQRAVSRARKQGGVSKYELTVEDFVETANSTRQAAIK